MTNEKLFPCAWLTDDKGGRCGKEADEEIQHLYGRAAYSCPRGHTQTLFHMDKPKARAEWQRNQRALMDGPDAAAWFDETQSSLLLVREVEEQRDELRAEVAASIGNIRDEHPTIGLGSTISEVVVAAMHERRNEFTALMDALDQASSIRIALGPLASGDLAGDVAKVVGWMAAIIGWVNAFEYGEIADKCVFADKVKRHCDAIAEYRTAMKGKADEVI